MISKETEDHLIAQEMEIVAAQKRHDYAAVEALLAADFLEIGGSGRLFSKLETLHAI